ncbi:MAG: hypothetical protein ACI959_002177 [Limisphaerales bacterium]|jgi:uncharacterized protein (DUF2147 family)
MKLFSLSLVACLAVLPLTNVIAQSNLIVGEWLNEEKDGKVAIYQEGELFYGKISWLEDATNEDGTARKDDNNPNVDLQNKALDGLVILKDFIYNESEDEWKGGKIYDPKNGKTYSCYMKMTGEKLKIRGFVMGMRAFGRTTYWTGN